MRAPLLVPLPGHQGSSLSLLQPFPSPPLTHIPDPLKPRHPGTRVPTLVGLWRFLTWRPDTRLHRRCNMADMFSLTFEVLMEGCNYEVRVNILTRSTGMSNPRHRNHRTSFCVNKQRLFIIKRVLYKRLCVLVPPRECSGGFF